MFFKGDKRIAWLCLWCIIHLNSNMEREHLFTHMPKFACHICLQQSNNQILHFVNPRLNSKLHHLRTNFMIMISSFQSARVSEKKKKGVFRKEKMLQFLIWWYNIHTGKCPLSLPLLPFVVFMCLWFSWEASLKLSIYCGYCILQIFRSQESLWASDC